MNYIEKIDEITRKSYCSDREEHLFIKRFHDSEIVSEFYKRHYPIPLSNLIESINDSQKDDILWEYVSGDYYIILNKCSKEEAKRVVPKLPEDIPIIIKDSNFYFSKPNVFYEFRNVIDLEIFYKSYKDNRVYFEHSRDYSLTFLIEEITEENIRMLEEIETYLKNIPNASYSLKINIKSKLELIKLRDFLKGREWNPIIINLADNLFFQEEDNPLSARSILRNKREREIVESIPYLYDWNSKIKYLDATFFNFQRIINFERNIDVLLSRVPKNASDLDKVVFFTEFMINYFNYDDENSFRWIHEVVEEKYGVCRDFSKLMIILLKRVGIKCEFVGSIPEDEDLGHAFNVVTIDGVNYFLDATWLWQEMREGVISSIEQGYNFLTDNELFGIKHSKYSEINDYDCKTYDREEIRKSIKRVSTWKYNYRITKDGIKDLFRKLDSSNRTLREKDIIDAMPGVGGR